MTKPPAPDRKAQVRAIVESGRDRIARVIPPGLRWLVGLVMIAGGILGFLPILGFWMIPLGLAVAALDLAWIRKWWKSRN
jgi:hypothetical protein